MPTPRLDQAILQTFTREEILAAVHLSDLQKMFLRNEIATITIIKNNIKWNPKHLTPEMADREFVAEHSFEQAKIETLQWLLNISEDNEMALREWQAELEEKSKAAQAAQSTQSI